MRRRSIEVPGLGHGDIPIPQASVVGRLLMSGGVNGMDPHDGTIPAGAPAQLPLVFANVRRIMSAAGGSVDDIVKMTFFVRDRTVRPDVDQHWIEMFPDARSRPARHMFVSELPPTIDIQCEVVAHLEGGSA